MTDSVTISFTVSLEELKKELDLGSAFDPELGRRALQILKEKPFHYLDPLSALEEVYYEEMMELP